MRKVTSWRSKDCTLEITDWSDWLVIDLHEKLGQALASIATPQQED